MDVKEAVQTAKKYVAELFTDETIADVGLEEVEFNNTSNSWEVTIGFSRPWQTRYPWPLHSGINLRDAPINSCASMTIDGHVIRRSRIAF